MESKGFMQKFEYLMAGECPKKLFPNLSDRTGKRMMEICDMQAVVFIIYYVLTERYGDEKETYPVRKIVKRAQPLVARIRKIALAVESWHCVMSERPADSDARSVTRWWDRVTKELFTSATSLQRQESRCYGED